MKVLSKSSEYRVLFTNFSSLTAELLSAHLERSETLRPVPPVHCLVDFQRVVERDLPHLVLIGAQSGREGCTALPFLQHLRTLAPHVRAIVLGQNLSDHDEIAVLHAGARGLLRENEVNLLTLVKCISSVAEGQVWANSQQIDRLLTSLSRLQTPRVTNVLGDAILSKREEEVLNLLSEGMSNRDLAVALKLSEHTVKNHLFRIFDKLGVSNRMEAVLYAMSRRETQAYSYPRPEIGCPAAV